MTPAREKREAEAADRKARCVTVIRKSRQAAVFIPPLELTGPHAGPGPELARPRYCYVCKGEYRRVHFFYDSMCPACGDFNCRKRSQTADLISSRDPPRHRAVLPRPDPEGFPA